MPKTLNETQQRKLAQHFAIENPEATAILRAGGRGTGLAGTIAAAFEEDYPELVARIRSGDTGTATATVAAPSVPSPVATRTAEPAARTPAPAAPPFTPAPQPAVAPAAADPIATFESLVAAKLKNTLLNRNSAIAAVSQEHPVAHAKYVAAVKQRWGIR